MTENMGKIRMDDAKLEAVSGGAGAGAEIIDVVIRDLHGRDRVIPVSSGATVYDLKVMWARMEAGDNFEIYTVRMRFIYKGREMDNSRTLASYEIQSGAMIHLIFEGR